MTNAQLADLLEEAARRLRAVKPQPRVETSRAEALCVTQKEAARLLGVSPDHFVTLGIKPTRVGNTLRYRYEALKAYLDQQDARGAGRQTEDPAKAISGAGRGLMG